MKRCHYCGKEYADDVAVCPVDGQPVINLAEKQRKIAARPEATGTAFNVKLVSPISSAGKYRVFVERSDLLFIQVEGGSRSILELTEKRLKMFAVNSQLNLQIFPLTKNTNNLILWF